MYDNTYVLGSSLNPDIQKDDEKPETKKKDANAAQVIGKRKVPSQGILDLDQEVKDVQVEEKVVMWSHTPKSSSLPSVSLTLRPRNHWLNNSIQLTINIT